MKKEGSKAIALAGIGSALALIGVVGANYLKFASLSIYVASSLAVMMPFTRGYWKSGILCYISVSLLAMLLSGDPFMPMPFIIFFGPYGIVMYLLDYKMSKKIKLIKPVKYTIIYAIKYAYFNVALWGVFTITKLFLPDNAFNFESIGYWIVAIVGNVIFLPYDLLYRLVFKNLIEFVNRAIYKTKTTSDTNLEDIAKGEKQKFGRRKAHKTPEILVDGVGEIKKVEADDISGEAKKGDKEIEKAKEKEAKSVKPKSVWLDDAQKNSDKQGDLASKDESFKSNSKKGKTADEKEGSESKDSKKPYKEIDPFE